MRELHPGWVARRRAGETATRIAREEGVSPSWVSARTVAAGPFPRLPPVPPDVTEGWVADRRGGWSIRSIARRDDVLVRDVARVTRPFGPFPRGRAVYGSGEPLGMVALSRLLGVGDPTVWRWHNTGRLPPADFYTVAGKPRWRRDTIEDWLELAELGTCPSCGARAWSVSRHRGAVH